MPASRKSEKFSQIGYLKVEESAANTLTFAGLSVFSNVLSNQGMIIHQVEYSIGSAALQELDAEGDSINFGISGSDSLTTLDLDDPEVYDFNVLRRIDFGTAGSAETIMMPYMKDFSQLPGGGILVPADRLYTYVQGISLVSAITAHCRFRYTLITLSPVDYLELAQTLRVLK